MTDYCAALWGAFTALLPVLLTVSALTLAAFIVDAALSERKW